MQMMQTRRILFYTFAVLFVIIAPILTAFSLGYTIDFSTARVEKTGGIFVKSGVPRLSIFLDGTFKKETSLISGGALLTEITPATHLLRIEKDGYFPWFKTVVVSESLVAEFRNIVLVPNPVPSATSTKEEIASLVPASPSNAKKNTLDKKGNLLDEKGNILASNVFVFSPSGLELYLIDNNGFLTRYKDGGNMDILGRPGFYMANKNFLFLTSSKNTLAILDPSGGLFLLEDNTLEVITGGVKKIQFDRAGDKILIRKENEVFVRWLSDNTRQPFEKTGAQETIIALDVSILDTAWYYETEAQIILRTKEGLFLTEIDGRGGHNTIELISGKTDELFTSPELPNAIFWRKGKTWFRTDV